MNLPMSWMFCIGTLKEHQVCGSQLSSTGIKSDSVLQLLL